MIILYNLFTLTCSKGGTWETSKLQRVSSLPEYNKNIIIVIIVLLLFPIEAEKCCATELFK